ncbi:MAG: HAD-IA family hydrolase [Candidatus Sulfobium sp.]
MITLIIFDLDGTLVNSIVDITNALNYAIEPYKLDKMTVEKTVGMVGEGLTALVEKMLGKENAAIMPGVMDRFMGYYSDHLADFTVPYPGVPETLEKLADYRKAVVSNKREALSKRLLGDLKLLHYFDVILGSDSVGEKKPSPKPILHILDMAKVKPDQAVIVGDSNYDMEAGKAAGIKTIAVTYGYRGMEFLGGADGFIEHFPELPSVLERLGRGDRGFSLH